MKITICRKCNRVFENETLALNHGHMVDHTIEQYDLNVLQKRIKELEEELLQEKLMTDADKRTRYEILSGIYYEDEEE